MRYDYQGILKLIFPYAIIKVSTHKKPLNTPIWIYINKSHLKAFLATLRLSSLFVRTTAIDITGYEFCKLKDHNMYLNYIISIYIIPNWNLKIGVISTLTYNQHIQPASTFFPGLTWPEREISEMLGINFKHKLDARRLLLDYTFEGLPLSKQFPTIGFEELEYDPRERWLVYKPVKLRDEINL